MVWTIMIKLVMIANLAKVCIVLCRVNLCKVRTDTVSAMLINTLIQRSIPEFVVLINTSLQRGDSERRYTVEPF